MFVSTSALTRAEKCEIAKLIVTPRYCGHGNYKSLAWKHFGALATRTVGTDIASTSATLTSPVNVLDDSRHFCRPCLEREKAGYAKGDKSAHISRIKSYSKQTATTSLCDHLFNDHDINVSQSKTKQLELCFKPRDNQDKMEPAGSTYEFNRDLATWFALDLEPFNVVEKPGFKYFFKKNLPKMKLPTEATVRGSALRDVYKYVQDQVKQDIRDAPAVCLLFDGWTDKHKARGYLGLRVTYITSDWNFRLVTLSCKSLHSHTGEAIANHVRDELSAFFNIKETKTFSTHDGAANMMKASRLLRVQFVTHCSAHALNLLLVADGMDRVEEICGIVEKCKRIINTLHFKGHIIEEEMMATHDQKFVDSLMEKIAMAQQVVQLDEEFPLEQVYNIYNHMYDALQK
jgi:hypothetical protein